MNAFPEPAAGPPMGRYRSIWISDIHLGTRGCKAEFLLDFLRSTDSEHLYLVGDIIAARTGIRGDQDHAVLGGVALCTGLGDEVLFGAGQAGEPVQHGQLLRCSLRGQVDGEPHGAAEAAGCVFVDVLPAAMHGAVFDAL